MLYIKARQEIQKKDAEAKQRQALADSAKETLSEFSEYLTPCLLIDSNIWMNEQYDPFFLLLRSACCSSSYKLKLYGQQFDEIANIKKSSTFGNDRNHRARIAINRIEEFQKLNLLEIESITLDAKRGAYADPLLVKLVTAKAREGTQCTFVSDDIELRIRVRQFLENISDSDWQIIEVSSLLNNCRVFQRAWHSGLLEINN